MPEKKIVICLQVRIGSKRMFQKALQKISGKTILELCIERLKKIDNKIKIFVLTTKSPKERGIIKVCLKNQIPFFRGSYNNVLKRYNDFLKIYKFHNVIRATCDNLFINIKSARLLIENHQKYKYDYSSNHYKNSSIGAGIDIFSKKTIKLISTKKISNQEKEHINLYILNNLSKFKCNFVKAKSKVARKRLTLDNLKDYGIIKRNYNFFKNKY